MNSVTGRFFIRDSEEHVSFRASAFGLLDRDVLMCDPDNALGAPPSTERGSHM